MGESNIQIQEENVIIYSFKDLCLFFSFLIKYSRHKNNKSCHQINVSVSLSVSLLFQ